jgi:tRNA/tmRNA/rRNA uracil-C5-methylase (TrmA/RlmC/RlmD family)
MNDARTTNMVEVEVDAIGFEGVAIGRVDGVVHFVDGALPGELVRARGKR